MIPELDEKQVEEARKKRTREKEFERSAMFIIKYVSLLTILSLVAYGNRNSQSNYYYSNLKKILETEKLHVSETFVDFCFFPLFSIQSKTINC